MDAHEYLAHYQGQSLRGQRSTARMIIHDNNEPPTAEYDFRGRYFSNVYK